jgi:DNA-binding SARP family transcriptional activator
MNNTYKLLSIIKYTTLKIKAKSATKNDVKELLKSISPDENYLCTLLTYLEQVGDYELSEDKFEQLSKLLAGGKFI